MVAHSFHSPERGVATIRSPVSTIAIKSFRTIAGGEAHKWILRLAERLQCVGVNGVPLEGVGTALGGDDDLDIYASYTDWFHH